MTLGGSYEVLGRVAEAGPGWVWKGRDHRLQRDVALKQVPVTAVDAAQRLRNEARLLAGLSHPNIVAVFDLVEADGQLWLIEEWVDGTSLPAVLTSAGRLSAPQAVGVVHGALQGLAYVHRQGVVHGDISPANILLDQTGVSKLVDFGLAGPSGLPGVSGTPGYLSPEIAQGRPADPRSDVYSAAAVLATLLRGRPLFTGPTAESVIASQFAARGPDLGGIEAHVRTVLGHALAFDPRARYGDAGQFLEVLNDAAGRDYGSDWLSRAGVSALVTAAVGAGGGLAVTALAGSGGLAAPATTGALAAGPAAQAAPVAAGLGPHSTEAAATSLGRRSTRRGLRRLPRLLTQHPAIAIAASVAVVATAVGATVALSQNSTKPVAATRPLASSTSPIAGGRTPSSPAGSARTTGPATIESASVIACPIPPGDLAGLAPVGTLPATVTFPSSVHVPVGSVLFGTAQPGGNFTYAIGSAGSSCSADVGGDSASYMNVKSANGQVELGEIFRAGGALPDAILACPYLPAASAAAAASQASDQCNKPSATETTTQVDTGTANSAAAVVSDPEPGQPAPPGAASYLVFTAEVTNGDAAGSQAGSCYATPSELFLCQAQLSFFVTQRTDFSASVKSAIVTAIEKLSSATAAGGSASAGDQPGWATALGSGVTVTPPGQSFVADNTPAGVVLRLTTAVNSDDLSHVCALYRPTLQASCEQAVAGQHTTGTTYQNIELGYVVTDGDEALVGLTGAFCSGGTDCSTNSDPAAISTAANHLARCTAMR